MIEPAKVMERTRLLAPKPNAEMKPGRIVEWRRLSTELAIFRVIPEDARRLPAFEAGQYMALRRNDCALTKKVIEGTDVRYVPDLDADGKQKRGPVTHSYSIASAPFEAAEGGYLEFYIVLGSEGRCSPGRFTDSVFRIEREKSDRLFYPSRVVGNFTLAKRAVGFEHVLMVATGTGLAPFVSMVKQLHYDAMRNGSTHKRYTLLHANRSYEELAYHRELLAIEAFKAFDFVYMPSVSRPTWRDRENSRLAAGRPNDVLRRVFDLPPREAQVVHPELPPDRPLAMMQKRIDPSRTVILACGNPDGMADIAWIAARTGMRFEKDEW